MRSLPTLFELKPTEAFIISRGQVEPFKMQEETKQPSIEVFDETPEWLNVEYFERVLQKVRDDTSLSVQSVEVKSAFPKGVNYASIIYRVRVIFHTKDKLTYSRSYIVKGMPEEGMAKQKLSEYNVHGKEMDIYQLVIPELKQLMKSIGDRTDLYPTTLTIDRVKNVIVFKDLSSKGYIMADRFVGLDMLHTKMSLKLMAKLHASSLKLAEMSPNIFKEYKTGMVTRETDAFYPLFYSNFDALTEEISTWDQEWHYYANKLRKLRPFFIEQGLSVFDHQREDDLRVLVHSDLWVNNLLFKYDTNGKPVDVILLDFQFCCYSTPVVDLCYFFFTSTQDAIRQNCFDELMQYYYYHLASYVKKLNCSKKFPTLHEFQRHVLKKLFYAIYSSFIALPVQINEDVADADFEALLGNDERAQRYRRTIMSNKKYHKIIKGLLPTFDRKGLLDKLD
ncbi:uncharacterized protein LOC131683967 [Topomyia yanbarensis]|uniref:uncharacterized protein LOC131683967 n=1 Tax=Topomyia yanbarensis TaxID=2498891 RepID=UPI00273B049A|nr:uncharacterized protein LOC131683967 [Topomyia yanbarensis]